MAGRFDSNRLCSIRYDPIGYTDADSIRCPLSDSSRFELVPILGVKHLAPVVIASLVKTEKPKHNRQQDQTLDKTTSNKIKKHEHNNKQHNHTQTQWWQPHPPIETGRQLHPSTPGRLDVAEGLSTKRPAFCFVFSFSLQLYLLSDVCICAVASAFSVSL